MNTMTVWFLIAFGSNHVNSFVSYSPPLTSFDECKKLEKTILSILAPVRIGTTCVEMRIAK